MKKLIKAFLIINLMASSLSVLAQDNTKGSWDFGTDLMSRYVWRGFDFGAMPSIQPGLAYTNGGLEVGVWGAYALNYQGYQETDIYLSYTFLNDMLSVGFTDYYFPDITALNQGYFDWSENTGHCLELNLAFNGLENFPLTVSVNTFVYGADKVVSGSVQIDSVGNFNYDAKNNMSTYIEVGYSFQANNVALDLFAGYQVNGVDIEDAKLPNGEGFYLDGPGLINLGITASKDIDITDKWSLPVSSSFILNPKRERVYFVFGFSF